jgi:hypothetical protein
MNLCYETLEDVCSRRHIKILLKFSVPSGSW